MRLLAIDTTEDACSAALYLDGEIVERFEIAPRRHSELALPMMDGLLRGAGLTLPDLDALAFGRGPGAFTGLRIAASVIQGAAFAAALPVVPVSSLQALAQGARRAHGAAAVLAAFDARMGEVYWGAFRLGADGIMLPVGDERVCAASAVPDVDGVDWFGAGSGWGAYADSLAARLGRRPPLDAGLTVHAADVARLGAAGLAAGSAVPVDQALPVYLRDRVAWSRS